MLYFALPLLYFVLLVVLSAGTLEGKGRPGTCNGAWGFAEKENWHFGRRGETWTGTCNGAWGFVELKLKAS